LRITVIQRLEGYLGLRPDGTKIEHSRSVPDFQPEDVIEDDAPPFEPFKDLCKQRFLWYYESYQAAVNRVGSEVEPNQKFQHMPFESTRNGMEGAFRFPDLRRRLERIKAALDEETQSWAKDGLKAVEDESRVSVNLKHQFGQVSTSLKGGDMPHDLALEDGNPFVWVLTYFGRPMTNFDSGLLRIKMFFSTRFPEEQPRVKLETKIFHHLVAQDGTLCYIPNPAKKEDVRSHLDAIIAALEEDEPAYDPRKLVNLEACKLFWNGGPENKKLYHRKLRRSVQDSLE
jgi:ubiquitin-conjugating enzyme E2 Z